MRNNPLVSVIIPTHNRASLVADAVKSVLNQTYNNIEIIVIDDGSTDDTRSVVTSLSGNIRYVFQEKQGPGVARNRGIDEATGDWIAFLDSDDLWLPDKLSLQFKVLEAFPQYKAVHTNFFTTRNGQIIIEKGLEYWATGSEENNVIDWSEYYSGKYKSGDYDIFCAGESFDIYAGNIFAALIEKVRAACWTLLVHRDCLADRVRFHPTSPRWQDYWFFCQLSEYSDIIFMDCSTAENRGHTSGRLTDSQYDKGLECFLQICSDIYIPSKSPHRPCDAVIYNAFKSARKVLLKIYLLNGNRSGGKNIIKKSKDIIGFEGNYKYNLYKIAFYLPNMITINVIKIIKFLKN